jgi:hypothetical protein
MLAFSILNAMMQAASVLAMRPVSFNSNNNLADTGSLNAYVDIITSYLDKKRTEFDIPPKSYLVHLLNKHSDKIFVSGQSFSEWSTNFQNLLEI